MKKVLMTLLFLVVCAIAGDKVDVDLMITKERISFEINKALDLAKIEKLPRYDEYICQFGVIEISKDALFKLSINLDEKYSASIDKKSIIYFDKYKHEILEMFELFFGENLTEKYCTPNENLIYNKDSDKPTKLYPLSAKNNFFNGYKIIVKEK